MREMNLKLHFQMISNAPSNVPGDDVKLEGRDDRLSSIISRTRHTKGHSRIRKYAHSDTQTNKGRSVFSCLHLGLSVEKQNLFPSQKVMAYNQCFCGHRWFGNCILHACVMCHSRWVLASFLSPFPPTPLGIGETEDGEKSNSVVRQPEICSN